MNNETATIKIQLIPDGIKKFDFDTLRRVLKVAAQEIELIAHTDILGTTRIIEGIGYKIKITATGLSKIRISPTGER